MSSCYPPVRSASEPEALQRVSKRIFICIAKRVTEIINFAVSLFCFLAGTSVSFSIAKKVSNKAQDVVATYSQSNVRIQSVMWQTEGRLHTGFTAPASQLRILINSKSIFPSHNMVPSPQRHIYIYIYMVLKVRSKFQVETIDDYLCASLNPTFSIASKTNTLEIQISPFLFLSLSFQGETDS